MTNLNGKFLRGINLSGQDLSGITISNSDMSLANLKGTNLRGAKISRTTLESSDLTEADLTGAFLYRVNLYNITACEATFKDARIKECIMSSSMLENADFSNTSFINVLGDGSDFRFSNFNGAYIYGSSLISCDFCLTDMSDAKMISSTANVSSFDGADLSHSDFDGSNLLHATFVKCDHLADYRFGKILDAPIIGYKKAIKILDGMAQVCMLVTLKIPKGAVVFGINETKLRTNRAEVVDIEYICNNLWFEENRDELDKLPVRSYHDRGFFYVKGEELEIKDFDLRYNVACSKGIHFFLTKEEAINY